MNRSGASCSNPREFDVSVLRLGHRKFRDARTTTHVALVARAFGANEIVVADVKDYGIEDSVRKVVEKWGGNFRAITGIPWREMIDKAKSRRSQIIHLTMHGTPLQEILPTLRKSSKVKLVIVGATRVPSEIYRLADMNINITSEPHSEVAALAVFLDRLLHS